ncbi:AAA family ATPase [Agromyces endophyticus]|uniref:3'-5' exonuclease n=1 Tax=Agromyces sp. H17E-10 TaxID=2932244 RepID=UPI001FD543FD|nr:3'-5' exonuclease [Agromyces sp. H17E-10]UOQ88058.1 AAA family ATPase [Agromyces sp. H17E-10]
MPNVVWTNLKGPDHDKMVKAKIYSFLEKLREDDTAPGLHIEKMQNPADPRARTGRVDRGLRAVLYRLETSEKDRTYVYVGTFEHDEGSEYARTRVLKYNPINGVAELIAASMPDTTAAAHAAAGRSDERALPKDSSYLETQFNYTRANLVDELGFDEASALLLLDATSEDEVLAVADGFENAWQQTAALGLAVGDSLAKIRLDLGLAEEPATVDIPETEDERILRALEHPASKMQFTFVENDDELRRIIDGGDFGAWRVFLHPEQQRYASGSWNGPFRLTGGAGTGKTVVLLHRARHLAEANPAAKIVLTTFTRALAENLKRDLDRLDESLPAAGALGDHGILVRGVDQLATAVRLKAGKGFAAAAAAVFGEAPAAITHVISNNDGWSEAISTVDPDLTDQLRHASFFEGEYLQVVLPARVTTVEEYFAIRRPGRVVALDRKKRTEVWRVIEQYRSNSRASGTIGWAEQSSIAAAWLDLHGDAAGVLADHVLVDEGQDLNPSQWQFLRALARPGADDLFVAEDTHQRIYGQHVVLARYGIRIVGRSRRLTLNYRTTEENLRYALGVLAGAEYLDSSNEGEGVSGYRSARRGPLPMSITAANTDEMDERIGDLVREWLEEGIEPSTVAILARTRRDATAARDALNARSVHVDVITAQQSGGDKPVALTMHTAKGMEFSRVVLYDISDGVVPNVHAIRSAAPEERDDAMLRERSLLYVAASRARDALVVAWQGAPSPLIGSSPRADAPSHSPLSGSGSPRGVARPAT